MPADNEALASLQAAIAQIDEKYGKGFAVNHGDLIVAVMLTAALDEASAALREAVEYMRERKP